MDTHSVATGCIGSAIGHPPIPAEDSQRLVAIFKALGDQTRLDVFRAIAGHPQPICVCDIAEQFPVSQPTISHHLRVLREAGLITQSKRGLWSFYAPTATGLAVIAQFATL